jgi:hypothetical protein
MSQSQNASFSMEQKTTDGPVVGFFRAEGPWLLYDPSAAGAAWGKGDGSFDGFASRLTPHRARVVVGSGVDGDVVDRATYALKENRMPLTLLKFVRMFGWTPEATRRRQGCFDLVGALYAKEGGSPLPSGWSVAVDYTYLVKALADLDVDLSVSLLAQSSFTFCIVRDLPSAD